MESELGQIERQLKDLEEKAATASGEMKEKALEEIASLKDRRQQIELKLDRDLYSQQEREMMAQAEEARAQMTDKL
jgi:hypothetical protein